MIVSFVEGRIRIRDERLKNTSKVAEVSEKLNTLKGIRDIFINQRTGSLLIFYDKSVLKIELLMNLLSNHLTIKNGISVFSKSTSILGKEIVNLGMFISLSFSLLGALLDLKILHISVGILFLFFWLLHIERFKKILFKDTQKIFGSKKEDSCQQ